MRKAHVACKIFNSRLKPLPYIHLSWAFIFDVAMLYGPLRYQRIVMFKSVTLLCKLYIIK